MVGCATGNDVVVQGGTFNFVAPGGKAEIFYAPPQRQPSVALSGKSVTNSGAPVGIDNFPGVVVVNIWGSWCAPCRVEAPELVQVLSQTHAAGVDFLGIDVRDEISAAQDFLRGCQITYPSIFDPSGRSLLALHHYPTTVVPTTLVIDRRHRVAAVYLEPVLAGQLLPELERLLAER